MAELERQGRRGHLRIVAEDRELGDAAADWALSFDERPPARNEVVLFAGRRARLEWDVLPNRSSIAAAWRTFRSSAPGTAQSLARGTARGSRLREYANLRWLRDRLFQAPRPIAAGLSSQSGRPGFQFLLSEEIADAVNLELYLGRTASAGGSRASEPLELAGLSSERAGVLMDLAREIARMHALRFEHGDLTPDHVLVGPASQLSRIHFMHPSRGGPRVFARRAQRDLADLLTRTQRVMTEAEARSFVEVYVDERRAQGHPIDAQHLAREIDRRRAASAQATPPEIPRARAP